MQSAGGPKGLLGGMWLPITYYARSKKQDKKFAKEEDNSSKLHFGGLLLCRFTQSDKPNSPRGEKKDEEF